MAKILEQRTPYHRIDISQSLTDKTVITVDGMEIKGVRSIGYDQTYETVPEVTIQLIPSELNIDTLAKLEIAIDIDDVREAVYCLQLEMKLCKELRDAVVASARSALADCSIDNADEIAESVVERIFFGEDEWCKRY